MCSFLLEHKTATGAKVYYKVTATYACVMLTIIAGLVAKIAGVF